MELELGLIHTYIYMYVCVIGNGIEKRIRSVNSPRFPAVWFVIRVQDFTKMPWPPTSAEWHYAPGVRRTEIDDSEFGYGSCMASKAAGWRNGLSKNSRLIVMEASETVADQHWEFSAALDDILRKDLQKAVIVYLRASALAVDDFYREGQHFMWDAMRNLIYERSHDADILAVAAAGDFATHSKSIDTFPGI